MNRCPNCGNKLSDIDVLCPKCGTFVEVVQSPGDGGTSDSPAVSGEDPAPSKNDSRPELILYNDDLPPDDMPGKDDFDVPETFTQISKDSDDQPVFAPKEEPDNIPGDIDFDIPETFTQIPRVNNDQPAFAAKEEPGDIPGDIDFDVPETFTQIPEVHDDQPAFENEDEAVNTAPAETTAPQPDNTPAVGEDLIKLDADFDEYVAALPDDSDASDDKTYDESVYSESYLDTIKNMQLPEVDDLSDFDPAEYIRTYRETKKNASDSDSLPADDSDSEETYDETGRYHASGDASGAPAGKWLELEEVNALSSSTYTQEETPEIAESEPDVLLYTDDETTKEPEIQEEDTALDDTDMYALSSNTDSDLTRNDFLYGAPEKKPRRKLFTVLTVLIWVVLTAAFFFGFMFLDNYVTDSYGSYSNMVDKLTNGRIILDPVVSYQNNAAVSVSQTRTEDGQSAHLFLIDAPGGKTVTLIPLGETFALTDGAAELLIADSLLFSSLDVHTEKTEYTTDVVSFEVQTDKSPYSFAADALTLALEKTHYVRSQPAQSFLSTADDTIDISITVAPQTSVSVNGTDYSNDVGTDGVLTLTLDLDVGDNIFAIEAEYPGRSITTDSLTVTRQTAQTPLVPVTNYLRIYTDTFSTIGETDPDAEVLALVDSKGAYSAVVDDDGAYTLSCEVEGYGLHEIRLSATSETRDRSETYIFVEYIPEVSTFTLDAQTLSLRNATRKSDDTLIEISGTLRDLQTNDSTQLFTIVSGSSSLPCYYYGASVLEEDSNYTVYGVYDNEQSSFYAMYVL